MPNKFLRRISESFRQDKLKGELARRILNVAQRLASQNSLAT